MTAGNGTSFAIDGNLSRLERLLPAYCVAVLVALIVGTTQPAWLPKATGSRSAESALAVVPSDASNSQAAAPDGSAETAIVQDMGPSDALNAATVEPGPRETEGSGVELSRLGVAAIDFSLTGEGDTNAAAQIAANGGQNIEVRKNVFLGERAIGTLPIIIAGDARLFVNGSDVAALLQQSPDLANRFRARPPDGPVSFERLRAIGINLRYNPISDRILLEPA